MIDPCKIPEEEKTPLVTELLHAVQALPRHVHQPEEDMPEIGRILLGLPK